MAPLQPTIRGWFLGAAFAASVALGPSVGEAQKAQSVDFRVLALSQQTRPFTAYSVSALTMRDSIVSLARAQVGKRYRLGGTSPERGFDCSGLVKYVLEAFKVELPRTSREQSHVGAALPRDPTKLRPGDLLLFGRPADGISHIGIYVGNGHFVHASSAAGRVIESPLDRRPTPEIKTFKSARRVLSSRETVYMVALKSP
jgi:cell wall-associated NlpC family hydrolase